MKIEKILVAVDFSPESEVAVAQALAIAQQQGAKLVLLHVGYVPEQPVGMPASMHKAVSEYLRIVEADLAKEREQLEVIRGRISGQGVEVSHMVIDASPHQGICRAADDLDVDLVVTGTHGRTGIKRFVLGSVAEKVVRTSERAVLVARQGASNNGQVVPYRRILVPTDFSESADRAFETALQLAAPESVVDVLHCWYLPPMSYPYYAPTKAAAELVTPLRDSITAGTKDLAGKLLARYQREDVQVAFHQLESAPATGIQSWLEQNTYDLVVTGSHGRRGAVRYLLGSVAEHIVRHAPCSVMVVHAPNPDTEESSNTLQAGA